MFYLTDRPRQASWLSDEQRAWLIGALDRDAKATGVVHGEGVLKTIMKPMVLMFGFCNFGLFCGLASLFPWLPQIIKTFGLPASDVGLVTAIPPVAGLVGMMALSRHSDHVGERFYYAAMTFVVAALGFAVAAFSTTPVWIIVGFIIANVGVYGTQAVFWTIPQSYLSRQSAPGAIGLVGTLGSIGGATIPVVIGRAKDASGGFTIGFLVVSGVLLFAAMLIMIARRQLVKQ
jgi:MFS transporter, ACS family, tartrate transporter